LHVEVAVVIPAPEREGVVVTAELNLSGHAWRLADDEVYRCLFSLAVNQNT
jgi:hypothetical protein